MPESKLEKMFGDCAEKLHLNSLCEMRELICDFYRDLGASKKLSFFGLGRIIEFKFVKKMLYASDFKWPTVSGFAGTIVFLFHLVTDGARGLTIGAFHTDMVFMFLISICLFFSSYSLLVDSFNCNMQEVLPKKSYMVRMMKLIFYFVVSSLLIASVCYLLGLTVIKIY